MRNCSSFLLQIIVIEIRVELPETICGFKHPTSPTRILMTEVNTYYYNYNTVTTYIEDYLHQLHDSLVDSCPFVMVVKHYYFPSLIGNICLLHPFHH